MRTVEEEVLKWVFCELQNVLVLLLTECKRFILKYLKTNSMKPSPSWEANSGISIQEITFLLCNPETHYHVQSSPPLEPILSHMHAAHNFQPISLGYILILSSRPCLVAIFEAISDNEIKH